MSWILPPHGTDARARRHYRDGEKPCGACREAHNAAERRRHPPALRLPQPSPLERAAQAARRAELDDALSQHHVRVLRQTKAGTG